MDYKIENCKDGDADYIKEFYEKQGYEVFGVLEDCPKGHCRYYLKKVISTL